MPLSSSPDHDAAVAAARPRLSIICTGRNDDRAPDQFERLISLQRTLAQALRNVAFEFLFVEWNPDPDRSYLGEALYLDEARHFVVTREAHKRLIADAQMSTRDGKVVKGERAFLLNHANNVGLKHARGEWVLITNLDDLFPADFGAMFETGESRALALGIHPQWSYRALMRYRRAQRSKIWRFTTRTLGRVDRLIRRVGRRPWRLGKRIVERGWRELTEFWERAMLRAEEGWYAVRYGSRFAGMRQALIRGPRRVRATLRALVIRLFGGGEQVRRSRGPWWLRFLRLAKRSVKIAARFAWTVVRLLAGAVFVVLAAARHPRKNARALAKMVWNFFFAPRVNWRVGRVPLTPGTLYRVRRLHVSDTFARRGANAASIDAYIADVKTEAVDGPWNNHFPWTWACGDFLLMDLATWQRIGGFPQQIGQLHADSVTIFRIVAEGCPVVLLNWNVYHMDHEDRFDAVPFVEYDFENVHRYFGPGWTRAEVTLVERGPANANNAYSAPAEPVLVSARTEPAN